jgi:Ca-activated chloride channel family protein
VAATTTTSSTVAATTTTSAAPATTTTVTTSTVAATTTLGSTGEANLDAPPEVAAGEKFVVNWTGPTAQGDYITIVAAGAAKWTNEPYFYASPGANPGSLVAPITDGAYALWYVSGATDTILARRAIRVTPFSGALGGPAEVEAGSNFQVAWNGPNGPGDYVTIVATTATKWTDESYFYTNSGNPGTLVAPLVAGDYVLWYVTGTDDATMATRPITVTPYAVTLAAPHSVTHGTPFQVTWTGPNGPSDYITIVAAGSPPGSYNDYAYTTEGSTVTLNAPDTPGAYEIWYASDRVKNIVFGKIDITVT